jgi:hypothetical protein
VEKLDALFMLKVTPASLPSIEAGKRSKKSPITEVTGPQISINKNRIVYCLVVFTIEGCAEIPGTTFRYSTKLGS